MRALAILALVLAGGTVAAPVPKELKQPSDDQRFEGLWYWAAGDEPAIEGAHWFFEDGQMYAGGRDHPKDTDVVLNVVLRPRKNPAEIDMFFRSNGAQNCVGLYKIEGGVIRIASRMRGERPKDFSAQPDVNIMRLQRAPEAKK